MPLTSAPGALLPAAVFFDMDGVILDSEPVWQEAIARVFGNLGITLDATMQAHTAGMGSQESIQYVLAHHPQVVADVQDLCRQMDGIVLHGIRQGVGAIPGAAELIRALSARGVPLALVSTSGPALMQAVIEAHRLHGLFRLVLSSEEVGPGKPDPAVYREAVRRLHVPAAQGVAIEDTLNGARSAHGAGLRVLGFTHDPAVAAAMHPLVWQVVADYTQLRAILLGDGCGSNLDLKR
jgi:HAD superfamily hydrolase (TIGR01509 family)